jgi:hypothetical protein
MWFGMPLAHSGSSTVTCAHLRVPVSNFMAGAEFTDGEEVRGDDERGGRAVITAAAEASHAAECLEVLADPSRWVDSPEDLALLEDYRRAINAAFPKALTARGSGQARTGTAAASQAAAAQARASPGSRAALATAAVLDAQAAERDSLRSRMLALERQVAFLRIELAASRDREGVLRGALATAEADRDLAVAEAPRRTLVDRVLFRSRTGERFHLTDQCGHCGTEPVPLTLCLICRQRAGW